MDASLEGIGRYMVPATLLLALLALTASFPAGASTSNSTNELRKRTIVLGFDGMDPRLTEHWMSDGTLPNFARLRDRGHYQALATTNPAQSPVAWATFATGLNPGAHGIFDFLHRDASTYRPKYSITATEPPASTIRAFGWQLPLESGTTRTQRSGTAFWTTAERHGHPASVLRVPATYPADPITRMLSGMGVPDLLGSQGTFTIYTTRAASKELERRSNRRTHHSGLSRRWAHRNNLLPARCIRCETRPEPIATILDY